MVIPNFVRSAVAGAVLEVHGDGTQTRSFCHVQDTIRGLKGLMDDRSISGEIYKTWARRTRYRILDLAHRVLELTGSNSEITFVPYDRVYGLGIEDTLHREPSIERIKGAIGWQPSLDLERVLTDVIDHTRHAPVAVEAETLS